MKVTLLRVSHTTENTVAPGRPQTRQGEAVSVPPMSPGEWSTGPSLGTEHWVPFPASFPSSPWKQRPQCDHDCELTGAGS